MAGDAHINKLSSSLYQSRICRRRFRWRILRAHSFRLLTPIMGQLARALVLLLALAAPTTMTKSICWDYSDEEMGPLVPEWSSEPDNNLFDWSARRAAFA